MTDADTSPEAVERLAEHCHKACKCEFDDMDVAGTLHALSARVQELEAAFDAAEKSHRISDNGNMWRFWSDKAREMAAKSAELNAALATAREDALREAAEKVESLWAYRTCRETADAILALIPEQDQ